MEPNLRKRVVLGLQLLDSVLKGGDFFIAQLQLCLRLLLREGGRGRGKGPSFESSKKGRQTSASPRKWFAFSAVSLASDEVPYRPTQQQIQTE
jgi:hypothetical protein